MDLTGFEAKQLCMKQNKIFLVEKQAKENILKNYLIYKKNATKSQ